MLFRRAKRYFLVLVVLAFLLFGTPVFAIGNPTSISFGSGAQPRAYAFYNVYSTGDILFEAESYINYTIIPTDYTAAQAYLFEVLNVAGTGVIVSTPVWSYGDRPVSIYLTPTQKSGYGIVDNTTYILRITANPAIFATITEGVNQISSPLTASYWINQGVATTDLNPLRDANVSILNNIEAHDAPVNSFKATIQGVVYLSNPYGANIFLGGVPQLNVFCPSLFQTTSGPVPVDNPAAGVGTYAGSLTPVNQLGVTMSNGLTTFGAWLGIPQSMAGGVVFLGFTAGFCVWSSKRLGSPIFGLAMGAVLPMLGMYLGLVPLVIGILGVVLMFVLIVWHFFGSKIL